MQVTKYIQKIHFTLGVTVLKGKNLSDTHNILSVSYYVVVKVDNTENKTEVSKKGNKSPYWGEQLKFDATTSSTIRCQVYCTHPESSKEDHLVCEMKEALQIGEENLSHNEEIVYALDAVHPKSSREKDRTITLLFKIESLTIPSSNHVVSLPNSTLTQIPTPGVEFQVLSERWKHLLGSLQSFCLVAENIAEIDSRAKVAVYTVSAVVKIINDQMARDDKISDLACTLAELYDWLQDRGSLEKIRSFEKTVKKLLNQTSECAYFIRKYYETNSFAQRAVVNMVSDVDAGIAQYRSIFDALRIELILGTSLQTSLLSVQILEKVTNIDIQIYLNRFLCLEQTAFDPEYATMRGTHLDPVIDNVLNWATGNENATKRVFLLLGPAGSGKSSIAHFIAQHFHKEGRLGCGIFLHGGIENRNSRRISGTIIRHLAGFHPAIKQRMSGRLRDPDVALADIGRQFDELVATPLENLEMVGPVLVIIDGLDGCEDAEDCSRVLSIFANQSLMTRLPPNFRFLITSSEQDIQNVFLSLNYICHNKTPLSPNLRKIENLIEKTLDDLEAVHSPILEKYRRDRIRRKFLRRGGGDDIWTSFACMSLQRTSIQTHLIRFVDILFMQLPPMTLQDSITQLLSSIFQALNPNLSASLSWAIIFRPLLTDRVFLVVINHEQSIKDICHITRGLGTTILPTITLTNTSLHDVLADLTDERHWIDHIPYVEWNLCELAEACLNRMNRSLRHNMCGLPKTFQLDIEINGFARLIENHIPNDLQYAVTNWIGYILEIQNLTDGLMKKLHELLFKHLLHWIEVLSLMSRLDEDRVCASLQQLDRHISSHDEDGSHFELCRMIKDAIGFLHLYASTISQAHLHTYISALPLFPSHTLLLKTYIGEVIDERPRVSSNIIEADPLFFIKPHHGYIPSITLSPNGSQLVSCGEDQTVRICDGITGEEVHLMNGHSEAVICVAFSPDGKMVASCGYDKTICVWDVQTGRLLNKLTPKRPVHWVEFSFDGSKLLSRSFDDIITWKPDTGDVIGKRQITSRYARATFSPDGQQVATTSYIKIFIFDFKLEHQLFVLDGHKSRVQQVAWSLDGSKLASSSETETLLWNAKQKSVVAVLHANADSLRFTANQLSLVTSISGGTLLHTWDIDTSNHNCTTKFITRQDVSSADVRLDLGRVVAGTYHGDILMWDIDSLPTLSPKVIDNLHKQHDTITFHEPFDALRSAHHVDPEGWVCTQDGQKIVWVSKCKPPYIIKRSTGKLEFLDDNDKTRFVMESSSIE